MIEGAPRTPDERPKEIGAPASQTVYILESLYGDFGGVYSTEEKAKLARDRHPNCNLYSVKPIPLDTDNFF